MLTLAYDVAGTGPVLGYTHGLLWSRRVERSARLFDVDDLAREHRLIRYDMSGHGLSPGRADPAAHRWDRQADDLLALADQVAGDATVDWAGSSAGSAVLLWAAVRRPERFRRLILLVPPPVGEDRVKVARNAAAATLVETRGKAAWTAAMSQVPRPAIFADVDGFEFTADVEESLLPSVLRGSAESGLPPTDAIGALSHPTLILAWETDPVHPVATGRMLARTLPDARLQVASSVDDIRAWPALMQKFLRRDAGCR